MENLELQKIAIRWTYQCPAYTADRDAPVNKNQFCAMSLNLLPGKIHDGQGQNTSLAPYVPWTVQNGRGLTFSVPEDQYSSLQNTDM